MDKSTMEYVRKWGSYVKHEPLMKPIVLPKYDIGIILEHNDIGWLRALEPWCSNIYCDSNLRNHFITTDQLNTGFNLSKRVLPINNEKNNEILVTINERFNQQDFDYIRQLSEILADSGEPAFHGELGNLTVEIFETMNTYENDLIICKKQ